MLTRFFAAILFGLVVATTSRADDPKPAIDRCLPKNTSTKPPAAESRRRQALGPIARRPADVRRSREPASGHQPSRCRGPLRAEGGIFAGKLPGPVSIANTTTKWAGVDWIMVLWPLPTNDAERRALNA